MRKSIVFILSILATILSMSCVTSNSTNSKMTFLTPDELIGKTISNESESIVFLEEGVFIYTKDNKDFEGQWVYDSTQDLMAYQLTWVEDDKEQGYLTSIASKSDSILMMGHWYLSDINKTWYFTGTMSE